MEESYQAAVRRERAQSIQALNFELKYMIVGHITAFQGRKFGVVYNNSKKSSYLYFSFLLHCMLLSLPYGLLPSSLMVVLLDKGDGT